MTDHSEDWDAFERVECGNVQGPWTIDRRFGRIALVRPHYTSDSPVTSITVQFVHYEIDGEPEQIHLDQLCEFDRAAIKDGKALAYPMLKSCRTCAHYPDKPGLIDGGLCSPLLKSSEGPDDAEEWISKLVVLDSEGVEYSPETCFDILRTADGCPAHEWATIEELQQRKYLR